MAVVVQQHDIYQLTLVIALGLHGQVGVSQYKYIMRVSLDNTFISICLAITMYIKEEGQGSQALLHTHRNVNHASLSSFYSCLETFYNIFLSLLPGKLILGQIVISVRSMNCTV